MKCVEVFKEFYQTRKKHRKLTWIYSLGTCNINAKFDAKPIELIVTTYQVVLDLFCVTINAAILTCLTVFDKRLVLTGCIATTV